MDTCRLLCSQQHHSQINQSTLVIVPANGGIKADRTVPFCYFSSHFYFSQPVTNSLSSPFLSPLLKQNICCCFKMWWAFAGCYGQR